MPGGLDVILKRASESGVLCGSVKEFVPVCGEDPTEINRISLRSRVEVNGRGRDSQCVIGMLDGKDSDTHLLQCLLKAGMVCRSSGKRTGNDSSWHLEYRRRCGQLYMLAPPGGTDPGESAAGMPRGVTHATNDSGNS